MFEAIRVFGTLLLIVLASISSAQDTPSSQLAGTERLFPAQVESWMKSEPELVKGIVSAERLRAKLLAKSPSGDTYGDEICKFVAEFQRSVDDAHQLDWPVTNFAINGERLIDQLSGKQTIARDAFDAFDGRWYGRWEETNVNHDWRPSQTFSPPKKIAAKQPPVAALQYAWISNGFGWNYLSSLDASGKQNYVLGMVYYFEPPNFDKIVDEKPHVGFADSPTRLVWITEQEVFLEEVFDDAQRYVITGLRHQLLSETPSVSSDAVQATYSRDPNVRPKFQKLIWQQDAKGTDSDE